MKLFGEREILLHLFENRIAKEFLQFTLRRNVLECIDMHIQFSLPIFQHQFSYTDVTSDIVIALIFCLSKLSKRQYAVEIVIEKCHNESIIFQSYV